MTEEEGTGVSPILVGKRVNGLGNPLVGLSGFILVAKAVGLAVVGAADGLPGVTVGPAVVGEPVVGLAVGLGYFEDGV